MLGIVVSLVLLAISIALALIIYRLAYRRQRQRGEEGNLFVGLMILAACCLLVGFGYVGILMATGIQLPPPEPLPPPLQCEDGSLRRIDGTCPCSQFDLRTRC